MIGCWRKQRAEQLAPDLRAEEGLEDVEAYEPADLRHRSYGAEFWRLLGGVSISREAQAAWLSPNETSLCGDFLGD